MERAEIKHERVEMAEIMVSTLLTNISQLIANEDNLLRGVEDQVRSLQNQLQYMRIFLKDFERVHDQDVIQLVDEIRKVAGEAEDIIDMYVVNVAKQKSRRKVLKLFSPRQANVLSDVLDKITELEKRITATYEDVDKYIQTQTSVNEHKNDDDDAESKKTEVDIVGFVDEEKTLVDQLINGTEELDIISILGMGGLGKTTLARKVYGNPSVRSHFGCRAWVSVSQKFKLKEFLLAILVEPASKMTEAGLRKKIPTMIESEEKEETSKMTGAEPREKMSKMTEAQMKDVMSKMIEAEQRKKMSKKIEAELEEATSNTTTKGEKMSMMKTEAEELRKEISMMTEAELKSKMSTMTDAEVKEALSRTTEAELWKKMSTMTEAELRKKIIEAERKRMSMETEAELRKKVIKKLQTKRYLIMLDDVWRTKVWDELKRVLPRNQNGSRVLLTTRIEQVACQAMNNPPLRLRFLNEIESWKLLAQEVSRGEGSSNPTAEPLERKILEKSGGEGNPTSEPLEKKILDKSGGEGSSNPTSEPLERKILDKSGGEGSSNPTSEPLQKKILDKSGGLPLALVWLGNLLKEKANDHWETKDFDRHIEQETPCLDILGLSYGDLPPYLRPCFLYLGLFPQGYKIRATKLIQLWISEGFIENKDDRLRKEVVAESYLHELIKRSLIHVHETGSDGGVKTCHLHVLVRVLCNKLCRDMEFYESHHRFPSSQTQPRRLSVHFSPRDHILKAGASKTSLVRTFLCFSQEELIFREEHWEKFLKGFKLLKILDLGEVKVERISQDVEKLILLRYLRIKTSSVHPSIWALHNLQTLDLRSSQVGKLPEEFWGMEQLRHLYLDADNRLPQNPGGKCLYNLQTLFYISTDATAPVHIAESTPKLRKFGLYGYSCDSSVERMSTFNLHYLESLKFLNGCSFKQTIKLPKSITSISIKEAERIETQTIQMFQRLTKLRVLKFVGASFHDDQLVFEKGCFPELQFLKIESTSIKAWKLDQEAVPKLRRVVISKCPELIELPERLRNMPSLQELEVSELPATIIEAVRKIKIGNQLKVVIDHAPA